MGVVWFKEKKEGKMFNKKTKQGDEYLEIEAGMRGTLEFKNPVKLRINGSFEGDLSTKGNLVIGKNAVVNADIKGDSIVVFGTFSGNITAKKELKLMSSAKMDANITTISFSIEDGAIFNGRCSMAEKEVAQAKKAKTAQADNSLLGLEELSSYLEIDKTQIMDWTKSGKIPHLTESGNIRFNKEDIDKWVEENIMR